MKKLFLTLLIIGLVSCGTKKSTCDVYGSTKKPKQSNKF
jgi:hypothetical protein